MTASATAHNSPASAGGQRITISGGTLEALNLWALAAIPLMLAAPLVDVKVPRLRHVFYAFYPLHLAVLWLLVALFPAA